MSARVVGYPLQRLASGEDLRPQWGKLRDLPFQPTTRLVDVAPRATAAGLGGRGS